MCVRGVPIGEDAGDLAGLERTPFKAAKCPAEGRGGGQQMPLDVLGKLSRVTRAALATTGA